MKSLGSVSGRLVLIVGPSGAGKDTLIDYVRERLRSSPRFYFVRRVVTRPAASGENHEPVDLEEFHRRASAGDFALHWQAHGLCYGIPAIIDEKLRSGTVVIANVSRAILSIARHQYPQLLIINVTAPAELLAQRLRGRAREAGSVLNQRLARADVHQVAGEDVQNLDNSGPPDVAGEILMQALLICKNLRHSNDPFMR